MIGRAADLDDPLTIPVLHWHVSDGFAMRHIHIEPGLRLRFAGRGEAFDEGVEIGLLAASMAARLGEFSATLASTTLDQARVLAAGMNYRVHVVQDDGTSAEVMFLTGSRRPKLRLIETPASAYARAT